MTTMTFRKYIITGTRSSRPECYSAEANQYFMEDLSMEIAEAKAEISEMLLEMKDAREKFNRDTYADHFDARYKEKEPFLMRLEKLYEEAEDKDAFIDELAEALPSSALASLEGISKQHLKDTQIMEYNFTMVTFVMIDPKMIELNLYNGIPHLYIPVVTDPRKAAGALNWAVSEMSKRYRLFSELSVRDLKSYNEKIKTVQAPEGEKPYEKMPQIVIVVDEFADLMMVAANEVENAVCRLAQLARAAGIHLILATQRPSVDVITGLIKANMPSRIALAVSSGIDSRTIIDMSLGTSPNPLISSTTKGLEVNKYKCIVADEEIGKTSKDGVYAGGDAVTGAATVILAMGAGKAGAKGIDEYLSNK